MSKNEILNQAQNLVSDFLSRPSSLPKIVVVLGATASGKTWLAVELAQLFAGEVISADSRQIWQGCDIGTAKATPEEMQGIPHHLLDFLAPDQEYTLWDWKKDAESIILDLNQKQKLPIIAGGTGLYIDALVDNFQIPARDPALRAELEQLWEQDQGQTLHKKLQKFDPVKAQNLHPNSRLHLIRTLEILLSQNKSQTGKPLFYSLILGLRWDRSLRNERITKRIDLMLEQGLLDEVQTLLQKYDPQTQALRSIGYQEFIPYLQGKTTLEQAKELLLKNTKAYAKRQDTWFRRRDDIIWLDCA